MCNGATAPPLRPQAPSISAPADQNRLAKRRAQRLSASPMGILGKIFTWWDGATIGTSLHTSRKGTKVGEDHQGNVYYEGGTDPHGLPRRCGISSEERRDGKDGVGTL